MSEELEALIKSFRPKFNNEDSIQVTKMIGKRRALQDAIKAHAGNVRRLQKTVERKSAKEKELEMLETNLLWRLQQKKG